MKNLVVLFCAALVLISEAASAQTQPKQSSLWSAASATTIPPGRIEWGLSGPSRVGLKGNSELSLHPLLFFALPHIGLKKVWHEGIVSWATQHRIAYPTGFLRFVSREGVLGLLPATTDVPFALQLETDVLMSYYPSREIVLTAWLGVGVAPRGPAENFPVLDFPFLYPRFAVLWAPAVPRAGLSLRCAAGQRWCPAFGARLYGILISEKGAGFAFEPNVSVEYRASDHFAVSVGVRGSVAEYPVGTRAHVLPFFDVRWGL